MQEEEETGYEVVLGTISNVVLVRPGSTTDGTLEITAVVVRHIPNREEEADDARPKIVASEVIQPNLCKL